MGNPKGVGRAPVDRAGQRYGTLVAIKLAGANKFHAALWECKCDCGSVLLVSSTRLKVAKQCSKTCPLGVHVKHGATTHRTQSKEHKAWADMKRRCFNKNSPNYHCYGGRGITICAEWVDNFAAFLEHIGLAPEGHRMSVDRINNDGNYEPGNVRWATPEEQQANRRCSK